MNDNQFARKNTKPSIDGVSLRPTVRFSVGSTAQPKKQFTHQQIGINNSSGNVGEFKRPEGFHASSQGNVSFASPKPAETFVIDRKSAKKQKKDKNLNKINKKSGGKAKKALKIFSILLVILILVGGFLFFKGYITLKKVLHGGGGAAALNKNIEPSQLNGEGDGRVNILVLGRAGAGHDGADLTDTIILASIDPVAKETALVSVPRDLWVNVNGSYMKANAAFVTGRDNYLAKQRTVTDQIRSQADDQGFKTIESTISTVLGVPINYHLMVDFSGFEQAVDSVGGVMVNAPASVQEQLRIDNKNYFLNVKPGIQEMDGLKALAYSRSRYTSPRGDFDRSERQRLLIAALKDKILSASTFTNPQKISNLISTFGNHVQTNFSVNDMQRLYEISKQIPGDKIASVGLADPPNNFVQTDNVNGLSVVVPRAGIGNYKEIQSYIRNSLRDSFLKSENASIMVLNGTNKPGLASQKGEELKSFGYTIVKVDNAPTRNYPKTVVVNLRNGSKKFTQNYLEKRFGVSAVSSIPDSTIDPSSADFVIILGSDQASGQ